MIQVARRPLSLETPTDDEEDSVLGDFIEDDEAPRLMNQLHIICFANISKMC
jgi:DNA-directed RNA polymerase sigma subunit (sigma70/sigma32)